MVASLRVWVYPLNVVICLSICGFISDYGNVLLQTSQTGVCSISLHCIPLCIAMKKATEHITQMQDQWECREPTPVLVHMKDLQRSANRAYYPECTIIHKCQKSSGCCSNGEICGVKSAVNVTLHFWVSPHSYLLNLVLSYSFLY